MGKSSFAIVASISTLFISAVASAAPTPLYSYNWNEKSTNPTADRSLNQGTGISTLSDGTPLDNEDAVMNNAGATTPLFSANGAGVTGLAGDYALDLSSATGMGALDNASDINARVLRPASLKSLSTFTLATWIKTDTQVSSSARLFAFSDGSVGGGGFTVVANPASTFSLNIGGLSTSSPASYTETNEWTFFAVSFDDAANTVKFFKSEGPGQPVTEISTTSAFAGSNANVSAATYFMVFGNAPDNRPFDGLLDNTQIYGSALSLADLNEIATVAVPEPGTVGLGAGAMLIASLRRRRVAR